MEENTNIDATKKNNSVIGIVLVVVVLLAVGGFFFLNNQKSTNTNSSAPQVEAENTQSSTAPSGPVKEFTVDGSNYEFSPTKIEVNKGDTVKITFKDDDGMHNLVVDGYNVKTNIIKGGSEDTIQFVADKSGTFEYYCSVANHKEEGMVGSLIVN